MNYIYPCPQCKTELRFPLDRGTLVLKCPSCGHSFIADPDNTDIFQEGRFEFPGKRSIPQKPASNFSIKDFFEQLQNLDYKRVVTIVLFAILFLYVLRNFSGGKSTFTPSQKEKQSDPRIKANPQKKQPDPEFEI